MGGQTTELTTTELTMALVWNSGSFETKQQPLLRHYNPRVSVLCFDATGGYKGVR